MTFQELAHLYYGWTTYEVSNEDFAEAMDAINQGRIAKSLRKLSGEFPSWEKFLNADAKVHYQIIKVMNRMAVKEEAAFTDKQRLPGWCEHGTFRGLCDQCMNVEP